jgi:hypothetical protein
VRRVQRDADRVVLVRRDLLGRAREVLRQGAAEHRTAVELGPIDMGRVHRGIRRIRRHSDGLRLARKVGADHTAADLAGGVVRPVDMAVAQRDPERLRVFVDRDLLARARNRLVQLAAEHRVLVGVRPIHVGLVHGHSERIRLLVGDGLGTAWQ